MSAPDKGGNVTNKRSALVKRWLPCCALVVAGLVATALSPATALAACATSDSIEVCSTAAPSPAQPGQVVRFSDSSPVGEHPCPSAAGSSWNFGDGATAGGADAVHVYAKPGTYTVTLTRLWDFEFPKSGYHCEASAAVTQTITIMSPPAINPGSRPSISGTSLQGQLLTESHAGWSPNPSSYAYQWEDCAPAGGSCSPIAGATADAHLLSAADVGHTIVVQETAANAVGPGIPVVSQATPVVQSAIPADSSLPSISGTAIAGHTLTAAHGVWSNFPIVYADQWEDCDATGSHCSSIAGATGQSYTLAASDVGSTVRVRENAANGYGNSVPVISPATARIAAAAGSGGHAGGPSGASVGGAPSGSRTITVCPSGTAATGTGCPAISLPRGCVHAGDPLRVAIPSARQIASIRYTIDHRSRWVRGHGRRFAAMLSTRGLASGTHHLTARITFRSHRYRKSSKTRPFTIC
jgi:PKD repeat protein